jgi:hypothetical protein
MSKKLHINLNPCYGQNVRFERVCTHGSPSQGPSASLPFTLARQYVRNLKECAGHILNDKIKIPTPRAHWHQLATASPMPDSGYLPVVAQVSQSLARSLSCVRVRMLRPLQDASESARTSHGGLFSRTLIEALTSSFLPTKFLIT